MNLMDFSGDFRINYPEANVNLPEAEFVEHEDKLVRPVPGENTGAVVRKLSSQGV